MYVQDNGLSVGLPTILTSHSTRSICHVTLMGLYLSFSFFFVIESVFVISIFNTIKQTS